MGNVMTEIWPILLGAVLSAIGMYVGFINKMRSQIAVLEDNVEDLQDKCKEITDKSGAMAVLEDKVKRLESRQDSHSKKYDELMSTINELKLEMVKGFARLASDINSFNSMVEASDKGVVINTNKK